MDDLILPNLITEKIGRYCWDDQISVVHQKMAELKNRNYGFIEAELQFIHPYRWCVFCFECNYRHTFWTQSKKLRCPQDPTHTLDPHSAKIIE